MIKKTVFVFNFDLWSCFVLTVTKGRFFKAIKPKTLVEHME